MPEWRRVYLDHSASTPTDPRVVEAMLPYFTEVFGNASSAHTFGREAERAIERARETVAGIFNCHPSEVVFTSGGSESDNLAIRGAALAARTRGEGHHLITTPVEHSAVSRTVEQLVDYLGFEQTILPVDAYGSVDVEDFAASITDKTTVASIMYVNNEVGTILPIPRLAEIAREKGVIFHTDAVQAAGQLTLDVEQLGVDMMSVSAHKFYGPKGVGALYVRDGVELVPSQSGGSHEAGRRAGTHNTPFIVGLARALELGHAELEQRQAHYIRMRDRLIAGVLAEVEGSRLTGHATERLPSHASFVFDHVDGNKLLMHLDMKGVAASSASACKTGNPEPSGVLLAMGYDREAALSSLRLSVGKDTTDEDVDYAVQVIAESVSALRRLQNMLRHG